MEELKPCPFCGSSSELCVIGGDECGWYVECFNCFATGGDAGTRDKAIDAWNTRAERTCTVEKFQQNPSYGDYYCELSCGHWFDVVDDMPPAYCPICGAKVVEE